MMSKCQLAQKQYAKAESFAKKAKTVYPQEGQAYYLSGFAKIKQKDYASAYEEFNYYEKLLPGNPNIIFLRDYLWRGWSESRNRLTNIITIFKLSTRVKRRNMRINVW